MSGNFDILSKLPAELKHAILSYLTAKDFCYCSFVSKEWREATNLDYFWKRFCLSNLDTTGKYVDLPRNNCDSFGNLQPTCRYKQVYSTITKALLDWNFAKPMSIAELPSVSETAYGKNVMASVCKGNVTFFFLGEEERTQNMPAIFEDANTWTYSWVGGSHDELFVLKAYKKFHLYYICYVPKNERFHCDCVIYVKNSELVYADTVDITGKNQTEDIEPNAYPCGVVQNILVVPAQLDEKIELHFCSVSLRRTLNRVREWKECLRQTWRSFQDYFCLLSTKELLVYNFNGTLCKKLYCSMDEHSLYAFKRNPNELDQRIKHEIHLNKCVFVAGFMIVKGQDPFCVANSESQEGFIFIWEKETGYLIRKISDSISHVSLHPSLPVVSYVNGRFTLVIEDIDKNAYQTLNIDRIGEPSKHAHIGSYIAGKYLIVYTKYKDTWGHETIWSGLIDIENMKIHRYIKEFNLKSLRKITRNIIEGYHVNSERYSGFKVERFLRH